MSWAVADRILLTLWVGAQWAVGYLAVPILFNHLDDRALAGTLAGQMFHAVAWLGLACGGLLLVAHAVSGTLRHWRSLIVVAMLLLVAAGEFLLHPWVAELRAGGLIEGGAAMARFKQLHGLSAVLYLVTSLLGLVLVLAGAEKRVDE